MGVQTELVTGHSRESGWAVAEKNGFPTHGVHAQTLPWGKLFVAEEDQPAGLSLTESMMRQRLPRHLSVS